MSKKAHFNPKSKTWLISFAVMAVLSICVVVGSMFISNLSDKINSQPVDVDFTISTTVPLAVQENELNITSVEKALDTKNNVVAYVIKGTTVGYNQESPIEMQTTITADGSVVCGIDILSQEETEYLGVRITTDEFKNQFTGKKLPVKGGSSIAKGAKIDMLAKSTISSQAVIDGVNNAQEYVATFLAE